MEVCGALAMAGLAVLLGILWFFMDAHLRSRSEYEPPDWEDMLAIIEEECRRDTLSW